MPNRGTALILPSGERRTRKPTGRRSISRRLQGQLHACNPDRKVCAWKTRDGCKGSVSSGVRAPHRMSPATLLVVDSAGDIDSDVDTDHP